MTGSIHQSLVKDISYTAIDVPVLEDAIAFFSDMLELDLVTRDEEFAAFSVPSGQLLYVLNKNSHALNNTLVGYEVDNLEEGKKLLEENNISFKDEIVTVDNISRLEFYDPDGYTHAFVNTGNKQPETAAVTNKTSLIDNILWIGHEVQDIKVSTLFWDNIMGTGCKLRASPDVPDFFGGGSEPQDQEPDEFSAFYLLPTKRQLELSKGLVEVKDYYEPIVGFGVAPDKFDDVKAVLRGRLYLTAIGGFGDLEWAFFFVPGGKLFEIYTLRGWGEYFR
ncbi:MAG: hypothetical protein OXE42_00420 [Gammaproteobacteria bacterium]|nr:hypothetical protein [Gammaproteobacteria bacterium]